MTFNQIIDMIICQENIKSKLADEILFGKLEKGGVVKIDVSKDEIVFEFQ